MKDQSISEIVSRNVNFAPARGLSSSFFERARAHQRTVQCGVLLALAFFTLASSVSAQPTMSRGEQLLPINYNECIRRAEQAFVAEGWVNIGRGGAFVNAFKENNGAKLQRRMGMEQSVSGGCSLGIRWDETEEGWRATWTRRGNSNVFDVQSRKGEMFLTAIHTIDIRGNRVSISRTNASDGNNCEMQGTIDPDGVSVTGTYSCRSGGPYNWSAKINCQ